MIKVVVVDDEALVRSGFELILRTADDIEVAATAGGGEAVQAITTHRPDVVLLDIRMPDVDGLTILAQVCAMPEPPVVAMLTTFDSDEYVGAALRSGAAGFLLKDTDPEQLTHAVRALAGGAVVLAASASRPVLDAISGHPDAVAVTKTDRLSLREKEVLTLIAEGLSNTDIGVRLFLSASTVKDHVSAILAKLAVDSRIRAALVAQAAGLLDARDRR